MWAAAIASVEVHAGRPDDVVGRVLVGPVRSLPLRSHADIGPVWIIRGSLETLLYQLSVRLDLCYDTLQTVQILLYFLQLLFIEFLDK